MNIEEVEAPKHQKSTSFIMKTPLRTIRDQRKVRELPRKMYIEEVEEPKNPEDPILKKINTGFYFQSQLNLKKTNPEIDIFQYSRLVMLTNLDQYWRSIWINIFVVNFKTDQ